MPTLEASPGWDWPFSRTAKGGGDLIASVDTIERQKECDQLNKEIDHYYSAEIIRVGRQLGFNIQNGMDTRDWTNPDDLWKLWIALIKSRGTSPDETTGYRFPARRARLMYVHPEIFGSAYGLHQFRMRRIEFMDNPLAVALDAQVYAEQPLHWLDEDFIVSPEYRSYQQEIQANERAVNKTEVYSPDNRTVRQACEPYLDRIRQSDLSQILAAYKRDDKEGDQLFFALLVAVLGIKKPPKLLYVEPQTNETTRGKYTSRTNTVRMYEGNIPDYYCQRMGVLAHEMWHVYQEMKASYMDGKNHLYKYNNKNYIDSKDDYAGYRSQLVENEAFYFGDAVKQIVSDPCC